MHIHITRTIIGSLALACIAAGCSAKERNERAAAGAIDSLPITTTVPAEGFVQVTRTDSKSITKATEYKLTNDNFAHFLAASDSLVALCARDSASRQVLTANLADAGSTDVDAGLRWLESHPTVDAAINSAGISTRDYYVQGIAIASAEQFIGNPKAAPPTPTTRENAEFLRTRAADLDRLHAMRTGGPVSVTHP